MATNPLYPSLKELCLLIENENIDYTLVGGLAVSIWAEPRATVDIDFLVMIHETQIPELIAKLEQCKRFYYINKELIVFKKIKFLRAILDSQPEIVVDFLLADDAFKKEAISRKIRIDFDSFKINIAAPEDLIILKLLSKRAQDLLDVDKIIQYQKGLDKTYLKKWIKALKIKPPAKIQKSLLK